jgi:hypothetical protein
MANILDAVGYKQYEFFCDEKNGYVHIFHRKHNAQARRSVEFSLDSGNHESGLAVFRFCKVGLVLL